jgi:hypothetical protein
MADLYVEPTEKTPLIEVKEDKGYIRIEGRSLPENVRSFYYPILKEISNILDKWKNSDLDNFEFHVKLGYFNSSSAKFILDMLSIFVDLEKKHSKNCKVYWYYEDEDIDMKEAGMQIAELLGHEFIYIEYVDEE